jgi:hypothetical protein
MVTTVPGRDYSAGSFRSLLLGNGYRDLWNTPITVPVLRLQDIDGGLEPVEQGGGNQSITLGLVSPSGREYRFRSVDKHLDQGYPEDLEDTFVGAQIQDVISALLPGGSLVVGRLLDSTDILHVDPELYVMADDPALGEFRDTFAGMLGTLELVPDEGEDGQLVFAGSSTIKGTEEFLEDLASSPRHQLNAQRFLKARLFDLVINDSDRGGDQWRWAMYEQGDGYVWEPIPRDRDWAFVDAGGLLVRAARSVYPKVVPFEPEFPDLEGLTIGAWELDRRLLAGLDWDVWMETVTDLQADLTDDVIDESLLALPEPWRLQAGEEIAEGLRSRRDALASFAREYYELLSFEPDVHGTAEGERAEFVRLPEGDARLRIYADGASAPHFERVFLEDDTREVRLYLGAGDDVAGVTGAADDGAVILRVVGGEGRDTFVDEGSSSDLTTRTGFYDSDGNGVVTVNARTEVSTQDYELPPAESNFVEQRLQSAPRDWGGGGSITPRLDYGDAAGVILGVTWSRERQGFRTDPYRYRGRASVMVATRSKNFGALFGWSARSTTAPFRLDVSARGIYFESFRFYGFGNDTEVPAAGPGATLVEQEWIEGRIMGVLEFDRFEIGAGPVVRHTDPRPQPDSPLEVGEPRGRVGARAYFLMDSDPLGIGEAGTTLEARLEGFPAGWNLEEPMASADLLGEHYTPLPVRVAGTNATMVFRLGGRHVWGDGFPADESAFIGGSDSLRGYRHSRFAGRSSAFGSAEIRMPVVEVNFLSRGRIGILGFQDVGRVWWEDGESATWHRGHGGGIWFESLGFWMSAAVARGEETRVYFDFSSPF